jgi:DNA-binding MarR family transcriptional regulator
VQVVQAGRRWAQLNPNKRITFILRDIHNQIRQVIHKSSPRFEKGPRSQLQGGILGYLYHHGDQPVYQKDLEKEFRISRATASNTLQVMEREGLIVRKALDKDARLKRIRLTEEAYQNHRQIEAQMELIEARMTGGAVGGGGGRAAQAARHCDAESGGNGCGM